MYNEKEYEKWNKKYKKFQKSNKQSITKMVLDFNRKKSANIAKRVKKKDTGVIDERILHTYRWNDRIFKTKKIVPQGKNHGLIMLVDCSGSMQEFGKFESAIKQALILVDFCRKVGIKYKVVGFGNSNDRTPRDEIRYKNDPSKRHLEMKYIPLLREWFSHEQTLKQHDFMATYMMFKTKKFRSGFIADGPNSGTPLVDSIFLLRQIAIKFKEEENIDILNTITLTDGVSNSSSFSDWHKGVVSKLSSYDPLTRSIYRTSNTDDLKNILKFYKKVVGGNVIGFDITNSGNGYYSYGPSTSGIEVREDWQGYDHHYTFSFKSIYDDAKKVIRQDKEVPKSVEDLSSKFNQKSVTKNNEKILLSKFIDIIS